MTPYYADDTVTLYLGDMRDMLPALGGRYDCAVTDPPYGETSLEWDRWPDRWPSIVADHTSSMWCFGSMRMFLVNYAQFNAAWKLSQDVVWRKPRGTSFVKDRFSRVHEYALHWYAGKWRDIHHDTPRIPRQGKNAGTVTTPPKNAAWHGRRGTSSWIDDGTRLTLSVIEAPNMHYRGAIHPTEKSVEILTPLIAYACPPGGVVLDVFAGSGSTAEAARLSGRRAVLIEASEFYCEGIARRMSQAVLL